MTIFDRLHSLRKVQRVHLALSNGSGISGRIGDHVGVDHVAIWEDGARSATFVPFAHIVAIREVF